MKPILLLLLAAGLFSFKYLYQPPPEEAADNKKALQQALAKKNRSLMACAPQLAAIDFEDTANLIPLLPGWGDYRMPVTAANDSSRIYFEQGINMYYGFHVIEALASFEKAISFDNSFAMGYWGKALAYGPNINDFGYAASPEALTAIKRAKELAGDCFAVEKGLIDAIQVRYSADSSENREHLNQLYAGEMKKLHRDFPQSADVAALYVDALMVQHPWDYYDKQGLPKPWTPEIVTTLETLLAANPDHPGAGHYYIHAVEASNHPEKGVAISKNLAGLMPGVSHVVHMPSHIFIRAGYYNEGVAANEAAVKDYYDYVGKYAPVAANAPLYLQHNLHMQTACANMDGRYNAAMKASEDCRQSLDTSWLMMPDFPGIYVQYMYMAPLITQIRFGKWDDILLTPSLPDSLVYASLLLHYGRGLAWARKHNFPKAGDELTALQKLMQNGQLKAVAPAYANEGIYGAGVAEKILQGEIAREQNKLPAAIAFLKKAVAREDAMKYNEPRDWLHPTRQYLGNALLEANNFAAAEKAFREDLVTNPRNGWSLTGLAAALKAQHKTAEAGTVSKAAATAFERSDVKVSRAVF